MGSKRNTKKRDRRVYRFSLDMERHREVIELLESVPKPFRGELIAESIKTARRKMICPSEKPPEEKPIPPVAFNGSFDL